MGELDSGNPKPLEEEGRENLEELGDDLLSMENLDRPSPELWPEKGVSEFVNSFQSTPQSASKLPYSREFTTEDQNHMHQLASLPLSGLISKVKLLHDIAYQLGIEETEQITKGKYLNLFSKEQNS